jgi:uncharacterized protein YlxW (UPF0749 family)
MKSKGLCNLREAPYNVLVGATEVLGKGLVCTVKSTRAIAVVSVMTIRPEVTGA